ncbi:hypothetical protein DL769_007593 [Monosporascus sp. CRB-8-3]|nr:hypothetical protein DL769_007593 [Monosporascus sp. CRB-8-3]
MVVKAVRPPRDATPEDRHQHWLDVVDSLEQTHATQFRPEREGRPYTTSAQIFADWYANLIEALDGIFREEAEDDAVNVEDPEVNPRARAVSLLTQCMEFMNKNGDRLGESFFEIRRHHERLNRAPFTSLDKRIFEHLVAMTFMLHECDPGPHQAWNNGDLESNEAFEGIFKEFLELADEPRGNNGTRRHFIRHSQALLERAFDSLRLSKLLAEVPEDLFDERATPTYIDFPPNSAEFFYGKSGRPGLLSVKSRLGGELSPDEQARVQEASKKRDAPAAGERRRKKKARRANGYTMTLANADDDITLIQTLVGLRDRDDLPDSERIVTPTFKYRADIFQRYLRTISRELKVVHGAYYAPDAPPSKVAERNRLLEDLALGINHARGEALRLRDSKSPANIKNARIIAVKIQYMRSLYMKLLLSAEPPASEERIRQALIDRLDDWMFHEETWIESDRRSMERTNLSSKSRELYQDAIDGREESLQVLQDLWNEMEEDDSSPGVDGEGAGEEEDEEGEGGQEYEGEGRGRDAGGAVRKGPDGARILRRVLRPVLPRTSVLWDEKSEWRRESWKRAVAGAHSRGIAPPPRENFRDDGPDPFAAGGPPDYKQLPTTSSWDKLAYMIVLTHWRCFQVTHL